jgi:aryl-alcohol dehydrogenase-like predicted oxidoreductase
MGMSEWYGPSDRAASIATIRHALDVGVTFLDTADVYGNGHNEELVGEAIAGRRDEVQLATKFGIDRSAGDNSRVMRGDAKYVRTSIEGSLRRLDVDVIDLYYLHRPPQNTEIEDTVGAMSELVAEGKVRHLGLSEVDAVLLRRANAVHPIAAVQSEYSLWSREPEQVAATMQELGVGLVSYSPLGRGFLTGAVDTAGLAEDDVRRSLPRFTGEAEQANKAIVDAVRAVAGRHQVTPAQVALAWVHSRADLLGIPVVPIPGTRRAARLDENVAALDLELDDDDLAALDRLADAVTGGRYPVSYPTVR